MLDQRLHPARRVARHHQRLVVHGFVHVVGVLAQHRVDRAQHLVPRRHFESDSRGVACSAGARLDE